VSEARPTRSSGAAATARRRQELVGERPPVEGLGPGVVRLTSEPGRTRVLVFVTRYLPVAHDIVAEVVECREYQTDIQDVDLRSELQRALERYECS
jgi:hypothetical protein